MKKRFDVTTIGEGNIRLSVGIGHRLNTAKEFDVGISGAEANVVGCLSRLNWKTGWVSCLPDTPIGKRVRNEYRGHGINVEAIHWSKENRLGTLFVEYSAAPRSTKVIYDRKETCFSNMSKDQVDWDYLLDTKMVHLTGITVPLSSNTCELVTEAIKRAHENYIKVSFDVNFRSTLWSEEEAFKTLLPLIQNIEILFCSKRDAQNVFKIDGTDEEIVRELQKISNANIVVMSRGSQGVVGLKENNLYEEPAFDVEIIDRIGAGDGLAAGVLHGLLNGDFSESLKFGSLVAALALSQYGEIVNTNVEELSQLLENHGMDIVR